MAERVTFIKTGGGGYYEEKKSRFIAAVYSIFLLLPALSLIPYSYAPESCANN